MSLKEYRKRYRLTQAELVAEIRKRALARGDTVVPGLDQVALSRHENGHKRPSPYYQQLYCEVYGATPAELGFRLALPGESGHPEDVDRREFIAGAAGLVAEATLVGLPAPKPRMGSGDLVRLRQSLAEMYRMGDQQGGAGAVYALTVRTFHDVRDLVEHASYDHATGQALRELAGQTAVHAGWSAFDAGRHDDARRWWLEATYWSRLADADLLSVGAMASMARQAYEERPREAIDLATAAQRIAKRTATPRLTSLLLAREAVGHAGAGDATAARAALRRAGRLAEQPRHDGDPIWLDFYGPADFASQEYRAALMLGDTAAAEEAARTALALGDPVAYSRNHALDLTDLADVLAQRGEIDEAAAVARRAAAAAAGLNSARVTRGLQAAAQRLAPFTGEPGP